MKLTSMMSKYDAIVVGCGAAGATAFARLRSAGLRVLCLEAGARIGGRVCTQRIDDSSVVEMGAEWIHGEKGNATYEMMKQFNVPIISTGQLNPEFYTSDGEQADQKTCEELIEICTEIEGSPATDYSGTVGDYFREKYFDRVSKTPHLNEKRQFCEDFLNTYESIYLTNEACDNWDQLTLKGSYNYIESEGDQTLSLGRRAYHTLFGMILNNNTTPPTLSDLPDGILLNKEVTKIQWQGNNTLATVKVFCKDGTQYAAKAVIVTVSIGVLQDNISTLFEPQLPDVKQEVIKKITLGTVDKVCLEYDTKWWKPKESIFIWSKEDIAALPEKDKWLANLVILTNPAGNDIMRTFWLTGPAARTMESLDINVVKEKCESIISRFMGKTYANIPKPKGIRRSTWYTDPKFRGSYSYRGLACDTAENIDEEIQTPLKDESGHPLVLFAGEATNPSKYASVHGAIETGRREADRVIAALKKKSATV